MTDSDEQRGLLRISARRFESSPYFEFYTDAQTEFGVAAGRYYAADLGEDPIASYWALRRDAVLFDVPEKPWQIEGPDALAFLEHLFARRIDSLKPGRGCYAIACTAAGGTFMDGILFRLDADRYWYVQADGEFEAWMTAHRAGFDVEITDPRSHVLQLQGPNSMAIMQALSDGAIDETMRYFDSGFYPLGKQTLFVSRTGWTGELGYEIYSRGDDTDTAQLWYDLLAAGEPHGLQVGSLHALGVRRIEAGILDAGSDFDSTVTPYEAGLGAFVDLDKPDFIGKAALMQVGRQNLLYGLKCTASEPARGDTVLQDGRVVGQLTAGDWSPFLECGIGYVRFHQPADWIGQTLTLRKRDQASFPCEIVPLPFYDAEKRIPRGMDRVAP